MSTGDQNSPGNYGILDQMMALRWVYENIGHFNGDRNSITLFGPDAGAASAGLLMVNPRTYYMVSKVIAQVSLLIGNRTGNLLNQVCLLISRNFSEWFSCR